MGHALEPRTPIDQDLALNWLQSRGESACARKSEKGER
jgi:hypothetical protein